MRTFKARVRVKAGTSHINQEVTLQADSPSNAKFMLEAQYGKGSVIVSPSEVYQSKK
jgi:hypothetical protein